MNSSLESIPAGRDQRQRDIIPPDRLAKSHALVIGVGAIGRQAALQLAAIGVPHLTLFDHDTVQVENLASQGYLASDLNASKVQATADLCQRINPEIQVQPVAQRFGRSSGRTLPILGKLAVFLCVDTIQGRKRIWEGVRQEASFLADGRMSAEVMRVLAVPDPATDTNYDRTLFRPEQAYAGSCTAKATIYTASIAAGLMVSQFTRWLRGMPVEADLTLNLLAAELTVCPA